MPKEYELARTLCQKVYEQYPYDGKTQVTLDEVGDVADRIVAYAKRQHPDLVVMGTRGLGILKELALGSVSHKVIHLAPCPTATVH